MTPRHTPLIALAALGLIAACNSPEPAETEEPVSQPEDTATETETEETVRTEPLDEIPDEGDDETAAAQSAPAPVATSERLGAHQHGAASLAVTVQGTELTISFDAPLSSLGAPESPQSDEDRAKIDALKESLLDWNRLVVVEGAERCDLYSRSSSTRIANDHGDIQTEYAFQCLDSGSFRSVRFTGFQTYPALEAVDAVFVSDMGQSAGELTPSNPILALN